MKVKKIVFDILIIIAALAVFIIWYGNHRKDNALTSTSLNQFYKIYLITTDKELQLWNYLNQGAGDMASAIGVTYLWDAPQKRTTQMQIDVINKAVNDGANAILIAALDPKNISGAIEDAKARGVKIIYVDAPATEEAITTLATDNNAAGIQAAQLMLEELNNSGIRSGKIGIVSMTGNENANQREQSFRSTIEADGRFEVLETEYTAGVSDTAQQKAANMISRNADLVGIFATSESASEGVGKAIKEINSKVVGIGVDQSDTILKLLKDGSLKAVVVQNAYSMGYLGMAEAMAALKGKDTGPSFIDTGIYTLKPQ